jgi:RimJ/RimL family protein N-acetyltransferase
MPVALETARLLLRDERLEDVDAFAAYRCREAHWRHIPMELPTPQSIAERTGRLLPTQTQVPRTLYFLAAVEKDSGEVIGEATVNVLQHRSAEIGFSLYDARWGRGLGMEIASRLVRFVFDELHLHRMFARVDPANTPSIRILEKIRMTREGVHRHVVFSRGIWWDLAQYSILEHERARQT